MSVTAHVVPSPTSPTPLPLSLNLLLSISYTSTECIWSINKTNRRREGEHSASQTCHSSLPPPPPLLLSFTVSAQASWRAAREAGRAIRCHRRRRATSCASPLRVHPPSTTIAAPHSTPSQPSRRTFRHSLQPAGVETVTAVRATASTERRCRRAPWRDCGSLKATTCVAAVVVRHPLHRTTAAVEREVTQQTADHVVQLSCTAWWLLFWGADQHGDDCQG
jgi:hypothetical protein